MKTDVRALKIPGVDNLVLRLLLTGVPLFLLFGTKAIPILLIGSFFTKRLAKLWTQRIGPPLVNQFILEERKRTMVILATLIVGFVLGWIALINMFREHPQVVSGVLLLVAVVGLAWFRPSMAIVPILAMTAFGGSGMLLLAVPLVVMLARRDQRRQLQLRRSVRRTAATLVYALVAMVATLPFANASAGSPPPDSDGSETPASPTGEDSWFSEVSNWLFQRDPTADASTPSRPVQVPGRGQTTPSDGTPWLLWIAIAAAAMLLVATVVWFRRRGRRRTENEMADTGAALTLARLEMIGAAVGRRRASHEGALTFASQLASHTGDTRLSTAGPLVSGDVYGSKVVDSELVATQLAQVEQNPPPPPPKPPLKDRVVDRVHTLPISRRGALISLASLVALGGLGWYAVPRFGDLRDPVDRELAYVEQDDAPDEWHVLMGSPSDELVGWQTCSSGYETETLGWSTVGVAHRTKPLGAQIYSLSVDGHYNGGSLSVGTATTTSRTSVVETGAGPSIVDEPWRVNEWASVPLRPFATADAVLAATFVRDPIRTDYVDRNGDHFARYESLPPLSDDVYSDVAEPVPVELANLEFMRVIDIWTDDEGMPVRVRMIADGPDGEWTEWRRLDEFDAGRLVLPACEARRPYANDDWIGVESWEPSRSVPVLIEFDADGNPYDSYSWASDDMTVEPGGAIDGPIEVLSVGDLRSISPSAPETDTENEADTEEEIEYSFDFRAADGAEIMIVRSDGWPVGTRISAVGESVVSWDEVEPFYVYESFLTAVVGPDFPTIELEQLDALIEPLWENETHVATSVDEVPGNELTIMTQSDAFSIVVGRNNAGEIASIFMWNEWYQWRELGFEGSAPPSITDRESELHECLAGDREVDLAGRCQRD